MPIEIHVPELGESVLEAVVGKWQKKIGDRVAAGEVLLDLETEKVNQEITAERGGVLAEILKDDGATVEVGDLLGSLREADGATSEGSSGTGAEAPRGGTQQGGSAAPLAPEVGEVMEPEQRPDPETAPTPATASGAATPVARRLAGEQGVDLAGIRGSGPGGRITKDDVAAAQGRAAAQPALPAQSPITPMVAPPHTPIDALIARAAAALPPPQARATLPTSANAARERRVKMSRRRQTIARRLVEAQQTAAMLTTFNEVDMGAIMDLRKRRRESFKERYGVGLGFMSFFTRAAVGALKAFPRLNAEIQGDEIVLKGYYDIGIAVGAEEGLVVPVVRDADRKGFAQIEREIADLAARARANTLGLADLSGGTFTITNGGIYGSLLSTPILNAPQVAILGMHKIEERAMVIGGQVVARSMMYLALTYDHRIVDGGEAVRFLVRIKELLEDPEALLLEG